MAQDYYNVITNTGLAKHASASIGGPLLNLTHLAVGDGNLDAISLTNLATATALQNELHRTVLTYVEIDGQHPNQLIVEGIISETVGPFYIREVGIFDSDGDLFAIGKFPESFKPNLPSGSGKRLYVRMILGFTSTPQVNLIQSENLNYDPNFSANVIGSLTTLNNDLTNLNNAKLAKSQNLADLNNISQARVNLGLEIGVNVQAFGANLNSLANLNSSANKIPYFTGVSQIGLIELSASRNVIINGNLDIWQRAITANVSGSSAFVADRWELSCLGSHLITYAQDTDIPNFSQLGSIFKYSIKLTATTGNSAPLATNYAFLRQRIEGYNYRDLAQRVKTCSFWIKASKTGILCVAFNNSGQNRSLIKEVVIETANNWEKKIINLPAEDGTGTWDYLNAVGLSIDFGFLAGSNFEGVKDSWTNQSAKFVTSSRTNFFASNLDNIKIFGIRLEAGSIATPLENRPIQQELFLCQRYLEYYAITTFPGSLFCYQGYPWKVSKRANPTLSLAAGSLNGAAIALGGGDLSTDPRASLAGFRQQTASAGFTDALIKGECEL